MRDLNEVLMNMIGLVSCCDNRMIAGKLMHIKNQLPYTPPESMQIRWQQASDVVILMAGGREPRDLDYWEFEVAQEFNPNLKKS